MITCVRGLIRNVCKTPNSALKVVPTWCYSSNKSSPFLIDLDKPNIDYEVTQSPEDWKYVERCIPPPCVPDPIKREVYTSGWKPQADSFKDAPYYIQRTKNHMIPVYLLIGQRGIRRVTMVKKIQGDIWLLERQLRDFLQPQVSKPLRSQVNEFAGYIRIYGDHVNAIKYWLMKKDF